MTTSAKHTPSIYRPWESDGDTPFPWVVEDTDERTTVLDACGGLIADCTNGFHDDEGMWRMSAAVGPLAKLIAAAPALLEALEYALPYLRAAVPNPRNGVNADCSVDVNCIDRAISAIAAAKGQA